MTRTCAPSGGLASSFDRAPQTATEIGVEPPVVPKAKDDARLAHSGDRAIGGFLREREGLLAEDVLARPGGGDHLRLMLEMWCG